MQFLRRLPRPPAWVVGFLVIALLVWVTTKDLMAVIIVTPPLWLVAMFISLSVGVWQGRVQIVYLPVPPAEDDSDGAPQK